MASNYQSSTETTNFARLCRLVVDISCDLLREVLNAKASPPGIPATIQSQRYQLFKRLRGHQRHVIFPSGGGCVGTLQGFDFSLLYILARNLKGINIPPPNRGWGKQPDTADRSISANIERLRFQRNEAYGHLPSASLPESDFKRRWSLIRQSVLEIEKAALSGDKYVRAVEDLLTMSMDPEAEKNYIEELEKLHKEDLEVKDMLNDVKAKQKEMETDITVTARGIRDLKDDVAAVKVALDEISANTSDLKEIHPDLRAMIEQTKGIIKQEKMEKTFYCTKGFKDAKEKLLQNRVVVIKGNIGDGKTAIAVQLLHWLSQERQAGHPLQIHNMEKLDLLAPNSKFITFIDDIFGKKGVCKKDEDEWNKRISDVKTLFVDVEANSFLVITIRNEIFNSLKKSSHETIFTENNIIDLSLDTYKVEEEKRGFLDLYKPENVLFSWTEKEIDKILTYSPNIGFPQCCQLFYKSESLQKERSRFFEKPFHILNEALSKLQECSALLYLFLNDGIIGVKDMDPNSQNVNKELLEEAFDINLIPGEDDRSKLTYKKKVTFVKESLEKLSGVLVMKGKRWSGEDVYRFHHDSIYVAVALLYGKATPVGYIQNCPSKCLSYLTTSETATNMIVISSDHYTEMCERLLREFECKMWYKINVGSLDVWNDPVFVKKFVGLLNERKVDKLTVLNKACESGTEECALYLLSEGVKPDKDTDLWSLVRSRHRYDGNIQLCLLKKIVVYLTDETKRDVLNKACESGAEECALYLLSEGVKPDKDTDLWSLVRSRHRYDGNKQLCSLKKIVVYLNDETKRDVLNEACESGAEECALYLLYEERVKPDMETVFNVVKGQSIELLRKLVILEYDIILTARDVNNNNALHLACVCEREEMVTLFCNTYPRLVHATDVLGRTPLHFVAETENVGLFQTMEGFVLNSLYRVENQQTKCESVDGCVVHKYCVCAQYMSQLVDLRGRTVLQLSCLGINWKVCLYLCRSYPGLTTTVDKEGWNCLHYIARNTSDVDVFIECETYLKQYIESTRGKYDITTILTNDEESVLDKAKEIVEERAKERRSENNPLLEHLAKVFDK